jgi:hypothetical protein
LFRAVYLMRSSEVVGTAQPDRADSPNLPPGKAIRLILR